MKWAIAISQAGLNSETFRARQVPPPNNFSVDEGETYLLSDGRFFTESNRATYAWSWSNIGIGQAYSLLDWLDYLWSFGNEELWVRFRHPVDGWLDRVVSLTVERYEPQDNTNGKVIPSLKITGQYRNG